MLRAIGLLAAMVLPLLLLSAVPTPAQGKTESDREVQQERKPRKIKALSLAAQAHVIRVNRVLQKYTKIEDGAETLSKKVEHARENIPIWLAEIARTKAAMEKLEKPLKVLTEKQKTKRRAQIEKARLLIEAAPSQLDKMREDALAHIAKAIPLLDKMHTVSKLEGQDRVAMWNSYAYVYAILSRFKDARDAYEGMLKEDEIADHLRLQALFASGQLSLKLEEYPHGMRRLEEWFDFSVELGRTIRPSDHFLMAQGYYAMNSYDKSISQIQQTIDLAAEKALPLRERWLGMLANIYITKEDYASAVTPIELLLLLYPKREYWLQMNGIYGALEQRDKQLAIMDTAWRQGLLEQRNEFIFLAQQLAAAQNPLHAALVLRDGIKKEIVEEDFALYKMLGGFWQQAQETAKAVAAYRAADKLTKTGEMQYRVALLLMLENRIEEALKAARRAYKKGDFLQHSQTRVLEGQALLEVGRLREARDVFQAIADSGDKNKVHNWLEYVQREIDSRQAKLDAIARYREQAAAILDGLAHSSER